MYCSYRKLRLHGLEALALLGFIVMGVGACIGQETSDDTSDNAAAHYRLFAEQAKEFSLVIAQGGERLSLRETPLQSFTSGGPTYGSVYLWHDAQKRPAAIGTLGSLPISGRDYGFAEMHWLLTKPLEPVLIGGKPPKRWTPSGDDIAGEPLDDVAPAAASDKARLVQMRSIAREFEADMIRGQERNRLRLLTQPLYRYADSSQTQDGAIFAWVWTVGTDPELLMHIYTQESNKQSIWHYQPVRFTYRALELKRHNQEVWQVDEFLKRNETEQTGPYITTLTQPVELGPGQ